MILTPGVDFANILCTACTRADPKSAKRHCLFALLGSAQVKASSETLVKIITGL